MKVAGIIALLALGVALLLCRPGGGTSPTIPKGKLPESALKALNQLRDEINRTYGFVDGVARINRGPCGRFAKAFYECWNERFPEKSHIAFVMSADGSQCHHVLIRLPDGNLFDGGNGVLTDRELLRQFIPGSRIEDMRQFDLKRLDQMSYGLDREYPLCPNYTDAKAIALIEHHLAMVVRDSK